MTSTQRTLIAIIVLVLGGVLLVLGMFLDDSGATATGSTLVAAVIGFAFGNQNGEKQLARALTVLKAAEVENTSTDV